MNLKKMMNVDMIDLNLKASNKKETIEKMAQLLFGLRRISFPEVFVSDVFKRENTETTNMDMGVAIPHSHSPSIKETSIVIARLNEEISWEDYGEPVKVIFLLAVSPADKGVEHLEVISKIAELLIDKKFIDFLKKTKNPRKLLKRINKLIGG